MGFRAVAGIVSVALLGVAAACSSFGSSGAPSTPTEGGTPIEGGAPTEGGATAQAFCATQGANLFCEDFDDGKSLQAVWDDVLPQTDAGPVFDTTDFTSSPRSVVMAADGADAGNEGCQVDVAFLDKTTTKSAHYEFALRLDDIDPQHGAFLARVSFGPADYGLRSKVWLALGPNGVAEVVQEGPYVDGGPPQNDTMQLDRQLQLGQWYRIAIDVSFVDRTASIKVDGKVAVSAPLISTIIQGPPHILAGIDWLAPDTGTVKVHFDDVLLRIE